MTEPKINQSKVMGMIKLLPAMQYAFPEIKQAFYYINDHEEFVRVSYQYPHTNTRYDFDVCVTADSISAMYTDVWKEVIRRFG